MERLQIAMDAVDNSEHQGVAVMVYNFVGHDVARRIGHEQHAAEEQSKVRRRFGQASTTFPGARVRRSRGQCANGKRRVARCAYRGADARV